MKKTIKSYYFHSRQALLLGMGRILRQGRVRPVPSPSKIKNILFIRIDRIGDMVLSTPAIRALKHHFPKARLSVLASRSNASLLRHAPYVDEVIVFDAAAELWSKSLLLQLMELRRARYDAVIDPLISHDLKTAFISFATKAVLRVGFAGRGREVFYNLPVPQPAANRHVVDLTLDVVRCLEVDYQDRSPQIMLSVAEIEWARAWMKNCNVDGRQVVGVHPGAFYPSQRWPLEYYAKLADILQRMHGLRVVLVGGPNDTKSIRAIERSSSERFSVFCSSDLRKAAALISRFSAMVCNNSGPLHLSAALHVPTVSFMGPTDVRRWWPIGFGHRVLRIDELDCLGCERSVCPKGKLECLRRISPTMAVEAVAAVLHDATFRNNSISTCREI